MSKITFSEKYIIEKYYNIDEGFLDILPNECLPENNSKVSFHVAQMKFHREALEEWLNDNFEYEGTEYDD